MAMIVKLTTKRNGLGQHKYRVRFRHDGKNCARMIWAESKEEVEREIAKRKGMIITSKIHGLTWNEGIDIFRTKFGKDLNPHYLSELERIVREFREYGQGKTPIIATTTTMISEFMDWRRDRRLSTAKEKREYMGNHAANKGRNILIAIARRLRKEGYLPTEPLPFEFIPKRKYILKKSKAIPVSEIGKYLNALRPESRYPVMWMLATGWRSNATCTLRESDIDKKTARNIEKGRKLRVEPLTDVLRGILQGQRRLKQEKGFLTEYVFTNTNGVSWNTTSLHHHCVKAWKKAGLPHHKIHELRTTFGTLAHSRFPTAMVQKMLGHSSPGVTEHYKDETQIDFGDASEEIQRIIFNFNREEQIKNTLNE